MPATSNQPTVISALTTSVRDCSFMTFKMAVIELLASALQIQYVWAKYPPRNRIAIAEFLIKSMQQNLHYDPAAEDAIAELHRRLSFSAGLIEAAGPLAQGGTTLMDHINEALKLLPDYWATYTAQEKRQAQDAVIRFLQSTPLQEVNRGDYARALLNGWNSTSEKCLLLGTSLAHLLDKFDIGWPKPYGEGIPENLNASTEETVDKPIEGDGEAAFEASLGIAGLSGTEKKLARILKNTELDVQVIYERMGWFKGKNPNQNLSRLRHSSQQKFDKAHINYRFVSTSRGRLLLKIS